MLWVGRIIFTIAAMCAIAGCHSAIAPGGSNTAAAPRTSPVPPVVELKSPAVKAQSPESKVVTFSEGTNMAVALSPDGSRLVLSIQGTLFQLGAEGGSAVALTDYYQDAREPQFSPDGTQVVYQGYRNGNWDLFALELKSRTITQLTDGPFDDREPVFSPDMRYVVFSSDRSGNYDIWQLELQTGSLTKLTQTAEDDYSPSYVRIPPAARGGTSEPAPGIVFARRVQRDETEIRMQKSAPGENDPSRLVLREAGVISGVSASPAWQKNDQQEAYAEIAYQLLRRDRVGQAHTELKISNLQGDRRTLSNAGADIFPFKSAWISPTSTLGADIRHQPKEKMLVAAANGKLEIYSTATGSNGKAEPETRKVIPFTASFTLTRKNYSRKQRDYSTVSKQALGIVAPALSYNGDRVAFTALGDLWQWNFDTDELQQLTDDRFADATPSYSPDGAHIAFVSDRNGSLQLWLHSLSDGTQRVLDKELSGVSFPSWSPDGKRIAYFGEQPGNPLGGQLMLADLESGTRQTVGAPTSPQPLSWSKDGKHLAAAVLSPYSKRYREGVYELLVFSTAGKEVARINTQPHLSPFDVRLTPDGEGIGYIQAGQLYYQQIDETFNTIGEPKKLTEAIADMPAWSGDGKQVLVLSGDRLRRLSLTSSEELGTSVVPLDYSRQVSLKRWTLRTSRVFNGVDAEYQDNIDIVISGNRIESMQPHNANSPEPIIDVTDHSVIPGLFEMHAHMGNLREPQGRTWLAYGVTTVRDPGSNPYLAKERQEVWDSGRRPGPRTQVTGYLTDGNRVFYPIAESLDPNSLDVSLARTKALQLDFIKTYVRLSDSEQRKVVAFAHQMGIPTSSHELFPAAAHGMDHVEHIGGTSRRGYQPKVTSLGYSYADVLEILAVSNMGITATAVLPAWAVIFNEDKDLFKTPAFETFYGPEALKGYAGFVRRFGNGAKSHHNASSRLLRNLVKRDALLVTGTDSPFVPYGTGLHAELRLFERAGLEPWQVLNAATAKAAEAAGVGTDLGTLKPGMLADLVVVEGDPLARIKDADNVVLTIKGGHRYPIEELLSGGQAHEERPED